MLYQLHEDQRIRAGLFQLLFGTGIVTQRMWEEIALDPAVLGKLVKDRFCQ